MTNPVLVSLGRLRQAGLMRRLATRTGVLAVVGVLGAAGVAAAAVGLPVPVLGEVLPEDGPELVDVEEGLESDEEAEEPVAESQEEAEEIEAESDEEAEDPVAEAPKKAKDAENEVAAAAQSDCFKKDKDGEETEGSGLPDADVESPEVAGEDEYDCGDGEYKNHGQFMSAASHDRNLAKLADMCAEAEGEQADKCAARLADKSAKWNAKDADRVTKHEAKVEAKSEKAVARAEAKAKKGPSRD